MKFSIIALLAIFAFLAIGADDCLDTTPDGRQVAAKAQERMSVTAVNQVPIPAVSYFQERRTITAWVKRWDRPDVPTFVYLISFGKVLGYYVANGKPASTRSYVMPEEQVGYHNGNTYTTSAPDIDGTYGDNNPGIRFFTAEGIAVEWAGDGASYLYSDAPIDFGYEVPELKIRKR